MDFLLIPPSPLCPPLPAPPRNRCCQATKGGLRDKPGKPVDFYHTCYCLSGLSAAQHAADSHPMGHRETNLLRRADSAANVVEDRLAAARAYYMARPLPPMVTPMPIG